MDKVYKIAVIGPTGVGKSQFCNYIQKDYTNSKNEVSDSLDSCTKEPSPNIFERQNTTFNFIDTAGSNDSNDNEDKNLEKLINYLREIKEINNIFLLLTFGERLSNSSKQYIKKLGKIFTPMEFYNHLTIVFTKSGTNPEKHKKKKEKNKEEVTNILKESFQIEDTIIGKAPDVYFVDTEYDEDSNKFDETSQDTIDIILKKLLLDDQIYKYKPIDTSNLDLTGENLKKREEREKYEFELIKKKFEVIKLQKEDEEKKKKQLEEVLRKKKDEQAQKELASLLQKQEEMRKKIEEGLKQIEKERLELQKKEEAIIEEARKKKINIDKLDEIIDKCGVKAKLGGKIAVGGLLLTVGGVALTMVCPMVGSIVGSCAFGFGLEYTGIGCLELIEAGVVAAEAKIKKTIDS